MHLNHYLSLYLYLYIIELLTYFTIYDAKNSSKKQENILNFEVAIFEIQVGKTKKNGTPWGIRCPIF